MKLNLKIHEVNKDKFIVNYTASMTKQTVDCIIFLILLTISTTLMHILYYFKILSPTEPTETCI